MEMGEFGGINDSLLSQRHSQCSNELFFLKLARVFDQITIHHVPLHGLSYGLLDELAKLFSSDLEVGREVICSKSCSWYEMACQDFVELRCRDPGFVLNRRKVGRWSSTANGPIRVRTDAGFSRLSHQPHSESYQAFVSLSP